MMEIAPLEQGSGRPENQTASQPQVVSRRPHAALVTSGTRPLLQPAQLRVDGLLQRCGPAPCNCPDQGIGSLQRPTTIEPSTANRQGVPEIVHDVLRLPGQQLPTDARAFFEPRFSHDFSHVRVHTEPRAAQSARAVHAKAYTVGRDVVFAAGEFAHGSHEGRQTLAHELAHVIQQETQTTGSPSAVSMPFDQAEIEAAQAARAVVSGGAPLLLSRSRQTVNRQAGIGPPATLAGVTATRDAFNNVGAPDAANCAASKPAALGVDGPGPGNNGMEMIFRLSGPIPAGTEFEITRTKATGTWEMDAAGTWSRLGGDPAGTSDDHHDDDECLNPVASRIFVVDTPGIGTLDARGQLFPDGTTVSATATAAVRIHSFAEWVIARNRGLGISWTRISSPAFHRWHSIVSVADIAGIWTRVDTPSGKKNEIKMGVTNTNSRTP
jgi:hypothetical protein